ncbi:ATP-binding cassette domain-containing protein [Conexibacter sp. SYSU D00693]|uniref:ATP-binding cassette domain-containing protein n=1 Tax=Conexibacter sp. SYSU D00693 TaxID=2812560 RepID=UPI00196A9B06|nr:ABC transporter ATP-binding protein [Conexibacter sp. SYSU D00693]
MSDALLTLRGVHRAWRGKPVLVGADADVVAGAVTWLGGANGAGKTTLLRIATGLLAPDAGEVSLAGLDPWRDRRAFQERVGVVPAGNGGLYARLTVRDNLLFQCGLALVPRRERAAAVERAVAATGLESLFRQRVDRMSMGQRQRVRLAQALLHDPDVLLLDEPYTSLDEPGLERLQTIMDGLAARGGAALWLGPSPRLAGLRHDRALWLEDGRVALREPELEDAAR